jgi:mRNA interferase YafQ
MGPANEPQARALVTSKAFERDIKRLRKRGKDLELLWPLIEAIRHDLPLEPRLRDHALTGEWQGFRDCHVAFDWVLIYRTDDEAVYLTRTGTHSDLFG